MNEIRKLKIQNTGLTGYYLEQKFQDTLDETGLVFIPDETGEKPEEIELHYYDDFDLENKLSYILMMLTDK